ncbi:hypothetical protein [Vibrio sp. SCSIO 43137]|uniref:hypothetical protein n=1 Tax=Vibrio sp. SCSIO 43137 TaxID=3021011 RepID=UPI002FE073AA
MKTTTRKALLAALKRLVASKPNNRDLKIKVQNGKLKINKSNVEKEAGLSVGVLRNHPDIVELINKKSLELRVNNSDSATSTVHLLEEENAYLKNEKASLIRKKKEYLDR